MKPLADFVRYIRLSVPGVPEPFIEQVVLRTAIEFCTEVELLRATEALAFSADEGEKDLSPAAGYDITRLHTVSIDGRALAPAWYNRVVAAGLLETASTPLFFSLTGTKTLQLSPKTATAITVDVTSIIVPSRDATELADELYTRHLQTLECGTVGALMSMPNRPWSNPEQGLMFRQKFGAWMANARVDEQRGRAGAVLFVEQRPFA